MTMFENLIDIFDLWRERNSNHAITPEVEQPFKREANISLLVFCKCAALIIKKSLDCARLFCKCDLCHIFGRYIASFTTARAPVSTVLNLPFSILKRAVLCRRGLSG